MDTPQEKICTQCTVLKNLDDFFNKKGGKYGKDSRCKMCTRTYRLAYDEANWDQIKMRNAAYHAERREEHAIRQKQYDAEHVEEKKARSKRSYEKLKALGVAWHQIHPEKNRARVRQYAQDNPEKIAAYLLRNRERISERDRLWAIKNADHILHYRQTHREQTKRRGQKWAKDFPERNAAREQRRRARKRNLPDTWTAEQIAFMLDYWQYACAVCKNPRGLFWSLAHDHWIPVTSPNCPGTIATNMIPLCHGDGGCNNTKHKKEPHVWLLQRFGAKKTLKIEKAIAAYFAEVALRFP